MIFAQLVLAFFLIDDIIIAALIIGAATAGTTAYTANQQKKQANKQADQIRAQQAQESKQMNELIEKSKPLAPPKKTESAFQGTPRSAKRSGSLRDMTVRRKTGKQALRVPKTGSGLRIPY